MKYRGRLRWNEKGFAFVMTDGQQPDIFVPGFEMRGAVDGDLVEVVARKDSKGYRGRVTRIVERAGSVLSGRYRRYGKYGVLETLRPFPYRIIIPHGSSGDAVSGDLVQVKVALPEAAGRIRQLSGRVEYVIRLPQHGSADVGTIVARYGLPWLFSDEAESEAARQARAGIGHLQDRRDLREKPLFTIDGREARDFDDAVGMERCADGTFMLTVAIADVAELVKPETALDHEAFNRGFSVYFPEMAIPMLPRILSSGILSLNPGEDRLALAVQIHLGPRGRLLGYECFEAVIRSRARLCYEDAGPYLAGGAVPCGDPEVLEGLRLLDRMAGYLYGARIRGGALDFDIPEIKVVLDGHGGIETLARRERSRAERLIEEAMLLANRTICLFMERASAPVLYRIHEMPDEEDVLALREKLADSGVEPDLISALDDCIRMSGDIHAPLKAILAAVENLPMKGYVVQQILRAMKQACYSPADAGHFGLAWHGYLHFTSPIRRYSDLVVHRMVKELLRGGLSQKAAGRWRRYLKFAAPEISRRERLTNEAMQAMTALKIAGYMSRFVGEVFDATVAGIMDFGIFVTLSEPPTDGLVPLDFLGNARVREGRWVKKDGWTLHPGDPVRVQLIRVDHERGLLDFDLAGKAPCGPSAAVALS